MSGRAGLLSAILALQLVIVAALLMVDSGVGEADEGPFLSFPADAVDEIHISGADDESVVLRREGEDWVLADGYPADGAKVRGVLSQLEGLRAPWPVATSAGSAERFEVTADDYQRHLVLHAGGESVADLYLGTSPGYQRVHARRADGDAVYSVGLSNYQIPVKAEEWLDKALLQARGEISAVAREGGWQLSRGDEGWLLDGAAAGQDAAADLVRRFSELRVMGLAQAPAADAAPSAVFEVTDADGTYRLSLYADEDGNRYRVASDRREGYFGLAGYLADQLLVTAETLQPEPPTG